MKNKKGKNKCKIKKKQKRQLTLAGCKQCDFPIARNIYEDLSDI